MYCTLFHAAFGQDPFVGVCATADEHHLVILQRNGNGDLTFHAVTKFVDANRPTTNSSLFKMLPSTLLNSTQGHPMVHSPL
jgi:hypothetical protein